MKKWWSLGAVGVVLVTVLFSAVACGKVVRQGEVGVKIKEVGSDAGVQASELGTGRYWPPLGTRIEVFPITTQTVTWDKDEVIRFNNADGVPTAAPISVTFSIDPQRADKLVQKYKLGMDGIIAGPMRRLIQNAFVVNGTKFTSEQLYGSGAQALSAAVLADVARELRPQGIVVESINWAGAAVLPQSIVERINEKSAEYQKAERARAQVATAEAQARQRIAEAEGKARALDIEGAAIRRNPEVLRLRETERWNGQCPLGAKTCVLGGAALVEAKSD